ncbi:hypothetical protein [Pseudomonas sp. NC02]|nr:hypothetical protein [Pseudomonas sp. NC02]
MMATSTLKVRDDHRPVCFEAAVEASKFKPCEGADTVLESETDE